jgi:hypothetical protein
MKQFSIAFGRYAFLLLVTLGNPLLGAQDPSMDLPKVRAAQIETRAAGPSLQQTLRDIADKARNPTWIGYSVPGITRDRLRYPFGMYGNAGYGYALGYGWPCFSPLENTNCSFVGKTSGRPVVNLEGGFTLVVMLRAEHNRIERVQTSSDECVLNAGRTVFVWLTGVNPEESVEVLKQYAKDVDHPTKEGISLGSSAIGAIALHADGAADRALESLVVRNQPENVRGAAAAWLGERGKPGFELLFKMAKDDPSENVRGQVATALGSSEEPEALDALIRMLREDSSVKVREQALSWLMQKPEDGKANGAIAAAVENDPETNLKNQALSMLFQLPKEKSIPMLIDVARKNRDHEIRRQAIMYLSQTGDPQAMAFFEKMLTQ